MAQRLRPEGGWLALLLVALLVFVVSLSLQAAEWTEGMHIVSSIALMGIAAGYIAAKSPLPGMIMHPLALGAGVLATFYQSLKLAAPNIWEERLVEVLARLVLSGMAIGRGERSPDTLPFVMVMGLLIWLIAYGALWDYFRARNIWGVLLPSGIAIFVNTYYARPNLTPLLIAYLVIALLLIIRATLSDNERRWARRDIRYSNDLLFDFMRDGALFIVALVLVAWTMPSLVRGEPPPSALSVLAGPWGSVQRTIGRFVGTINYQQPTASSSSWFSDSMTFRGPVRQTDELIMRVRAPQGRYWRAVVSDTYTSLGWTLPNRELVEGPPADAPLPAAVPEGRELVPQSFTMVVPSGQLLFAAGQPVQVSLPTQLLLNAPLEAGPQASEPIKLYARDSLVVGQSYNVVSAIPTVDIASLRGSGTEYPPELYARYTALPDSVPQRVKDLAQELAGDAATPYDKALTLEIYLRSFPYNESIPGPNPGEDGVDYFLFREQEGYCDYYASAMAVMLRSLGVPARIARGYNQGALTPAGEYEIRQTNAHTWVEVYFPAFGWIEFEPTASEPMVVRPLGEEATPFEEDALDATSPQIPQNMTPQEMLAATQEAQEVAAEGGSSAPAALVISGRVLGAIGAILLAGALGLFAGRSVVQRRWRGLRPIERLYDQAGLFGRALGTRPDPTLTPHEYMQRMGERVPEARSPLLRLADLFTKQRFSRSALADEEEAEARGAWRQARQRIVRALTARFRPKAPKDEG